MFIKYGFKSVWFVTFYIKVQNELILFNELILIN